MAPVASQPRLAALQARPDGGAVYGRSAEGTALLSGPKDLAVGADGRIYVVESVANRVTVFNPDGSIATAWGQPGNGDGEFNEPWGIALGPGGEVYVADTWNHRVQKFDPNGRFLAKWGGMADTRGQVDQRLGFFWGPRDVALDSQGLVYVTDTGNKRVQVFDQEGRAVRAFGGEGSEPGRFKEPVGLAIDSDVLYVADTWNGRIQRLDLQGSPLGEHQVGLWPGQSVTNKPYLAATGQGVYFTAPDLGVLSQLAADGQLVLSVQPEGPGGAGPGLPSGVAVGPSGEVFVADSRAGVLHRLPR
jgi:DNA-binding beta-propeller fold protein YncE